MHWMLKSDFIRGAVEQMQEHLTMPGWSVREKIVLAAHILHAQGHGSGLAGQISSRLDDSSHFFTQRMGQAFDEIRVADLLLVDESLGVLDGRGMPNPANRSHAWIYREHPEVNCIIHTHPLHISALSMLGRPLEIAHMDSCVLFEDIAFLSAWPGSRLAMMRVKLFQRHWVVSALFYSLIMDCWWPVGMLKKPASWHYKANALLSCNCWRCRPVSAGI